MTITEFLTARLDEDEAMARAASPGPWHPNAERDEVLAVDDITVADGFALSSPQTRATTEHIARHDPARVLADIAAKRAIVVMHPSVRLRDQPGSGHTSDAVVCAYDSGPDDVSDASTAYPCITLRMLAQPYAEHEDYDEGWRV